MCSYWEWTSNDMLISYVKFFFSSDLSEGVLGFDCEWVKEGPVSLLQLATFNGVCALFRIGKIGYIPDKLKVQLEVSKIDTTIKQAQ